MQALSDRNRHQLMPGGMELDLVAPAPVTVETMQDRRIAIGERAEREHFGLSQALAEIGESSRRPLSALADDRRPQHRISLEKIITGQRRRLVEGRFRDRKRRHVHSP